MIRNYKEADGTLGMKSFRVQRDKVLRALKWLKRYNKEYRDNVTINEDNLNWMDGAEEAELPGVVDFEDEGYEQDCEETARDEKVGAEDPSDDETEDDTTEGDVMEDLGPAASQCLPDLETANVEDGLAQLGLHVIDSTPVSSSEDKETTEKIISACKETGTQIPAVLWPYVLEEPVSEYDTSVKLFCRAFPWLYPGGVGDINDVREKKVSVGDWAEQQLLYKDGRFAKDKMWPFFTLNYVTRRRNQQSGRFFIDGFYKESPSSISELQDMIRNGDTTFLNKMAYYSNRVRGSAAYFRQQRAQIYTWINHHATKSKALPDWFLTFSCAEYFWPDIIRLVNERLSIAGDPMAVRLSILLLVTGCCFVSHFMVLILGQTQSDVASSGSVSQRLFNCHSRILSNTS